MAVDQEHGTGQKTGIHAHALMSVYFDRHEAFPLLAVAFGFRFELLEKAFLEFQDFFDVHAGDEGLGGGDCAVGQEDVLELVVTGRQDGSTLVDLGGIEKIEHRKMLDRQNPVHALKAEAALAIQEVGDMSLLESCLLCQAEASQITLFDALPKSFAEVILQHSEFHSLEYSTVPIAIR